MYFHDYKLTTEQELGCKLIKIDPDKEGFDIFKLSMKYLDTLNNRLKIFIINKILTRILGLEFKSDNIIKSKAIKFIVQKKYCLIISNNENLLCQL